MGPLENKKILDARTRPSGTVVRKSNGFETGKIRNGASKYFRAKNKKRP